MNQAEPKNSVSWSRATADEEMKDLGSEPRLNTQRGDTAVVIGEQDVGYDSLLIYVLGAAVVLALVIFRIFRQRKSPDQ